MTEEKRMGRPVVWENPRRAIAARIHLPLHERIKADADAAGRSISEEIERRLERSFELEDRMSRAAEQRQGRNGREVLDQIRDLVEGLIIERDISDDEDNEAEQSYSPRF